MLLWRLSGTRHAAAFDGGYGLRYDGRWTSPATPSPIAPLRRLCASWKSWFPVEDPALMPDLVMVTYEAPDTIGATSIELDELPTDWRRQESATQRRGDAWRIACDAAAARPLGDRANAPLAQRKRADQPRAPDAAAITRSSPASRSRSTHGCSSSSARRSNSNLPLRAKRSNPACRRAADRWIASSLRSSQ